MKAEHQISRVIDRDTLKYGYSDQFRSIIWVARILRRDLNAKSTTSAHAFTRDRFHWSWGRYSSGTDRADWMLRVQTVVVLWTDEQVGR